MPRELSGVNIMTNSLYHLGSSMVMWLLPLLPAEDIYDAFKTPVHPHTKKPYEKTGNKQLQQKVMRSMEDFLTKLGVRKDLEIIETWNEGLCAAQGSNSFKNGGVILSCPGFHETDEQAFQFVFKHEICHLKNNDELGIAIAQTLSFISSIALFRLGFGCTPMSTVFGTLCLNVIATRIFRHYLEKRADDFAIQHSTIEELKGGIRLLSAFQNESQEYLKHFLVNFFHPSPSSRMNNLEKSLANRGISYTPEQDKVNQLKGLIQKNEFQIEQSELFAMQN